MNRDRLKKLAAEERFIKGIYNYCDRWCERCPQTSHCLNFSISEEEFSDPEARDIRNKAFWNKLSEILVESLKLLREGAERWGIDLDAVDCIEETEKTRAKEEAAENHLLCRVARRYGERVEEWFKGRETLFLEIAADARAGASLEEAVEVIRWYQYFICAKVMRAVRGSVDEEDEGSNDFPSDSDGSAKIALIAIDRSIAAWAVIQRSLVDSDREVTDLMVFIDRLRQAVEEAFPLARSFIQPGFDEVGSNG